MTWTSRTAPIISGYVQAIAIQPGTGLCVAGGASGTGGFGPGLAFSTDGGITWSEPSSHPFDGQLKPVWGVTYADALGKFVAVGYDGTPAFPLWTVLIATSTDGDTWNVETVPWGNGYLYAVGWSESQGLLVAAGAQTVIGTGQYLTSPDGSAWTSCETGFPAFAPYFASVLYEPVDDIWYMGGFGSEQMITSPDAADSNWSSSPLATLSNVSIVFTAGGGKVFAGGFGLTSTILVVSEDGGASWTDVPTPLDGSGADSTLYAGDVGGSVILIGGQNADFTKTMAVSFDGGDTWALVSNLFDPGGQCYELKWQPDTSLWIAGGFDGDDSIVIETSPQLTAEPPQYLRIYGWRVNISDDALETVDPLMVSPETGSA